MVMFFLVMESHFAMTGSTELIKTIDMFNGISRTLEAGIFWLWVESDSKILLCLLVGTIVTLMKFNFFVYATRDLHFSWFSLGNF